MSNWSYEGEPGDWVVYKDGKFLGNIGENRVVPVGLSDTEGAAIFDVQEERDAALISACPDMYAVLKAVEWSSACYDITARKTVMGCPICGNTKESRHIKNCVLAKALKKAETLHGAC